MRARKVPGLDPDMPVAVAVARIVRVRLQEIADFDPAIRDPANVRELHDMRIAAKRLRYILELAGDVLPQDAQDAEAVARGLQERIGEIHDCDVLLPRVEQHALDLAEADAGAIAARIGPEAGPGELGAAAAAAPHAAAHRGLGVLESAIRARRDVLYVDVLDHWDRLLADGFRDRVEAALDEVDPEGRAALRRASRRSA